MVSSDWPTSVDAAPRRSHQPLTLHHLVGTMGTAMLQVLAAPRGLDRQVRGTVLHDPVEALPDGPDHLLLMSGLRADDPAATDLVRVAAAGGYAAVVVKRRGHDLTTLVTAASAAGLAVVAAADTVPWRQLDALLLSVLGSGGVGADPASGVGDELFALANAIASVVGGSVAIEDLDRQVLAYSSVPGQRIDALREQGILARRVPDMSRNLWQYRRVLGGDAVVRFDEADDELARSAITIRAGVRPLGTIWAIEGNGGLRPDGERVLEEGARLAAVHLLRAKDAGELDLYARESALRGALDGSWAAPEIAFRLSLPAGVPLALVGFAPRALAGRPPPLLTHIGSALARHLTAFRPDAAVATTSRAVYVLLPGSDADAATRLAGSALIALAASFPDQVRAGVAAGIRDPAQLPVLRRHVEDILRVTTAPAVSGGAEPPAVAQLSDVHAGVLLNEVADVLAREPRLHHPNLAAMISHDEEHRTDYATSLTAWLDALGDVGSAAAALGVHPNTLRYRLRRATELFDVRTDTPDERLSTWIQLRLRQRGD